MGHCYTASGALVCNKCGRGGNGLRVRAAHCTFKIHYKVEGYSLNYCYPPDLCGPCLKSLGGSRALHEKCREGASKRQAEVNVETQRLEAGDCKLRCRWGDWQGGVPSGWVGALYVGSNGKEEYRLHPKDSPYAEWGWLSEVAHPFDVQWENHPGAKTKQVEALRA